jgi:hypothetical protein
MADPSTAPGWIALGVAAIGGVVQIVTAVVQRPKEKAAIEKAANDRQAALEAFVQGEIKAAREQFAALRSESRQITGSFPSIGAVEQLETAMRKVEHDLNVVTERAAALEREQGRDREAKDADRKAWLGIQLQVVEALTTLRFLQEGLKALQERSK